MNLSTAEKIIDYAVEHNKQLTLLDFALLHEWSDLFEDVLSGFKASEVIEIWSMSRNAARIQ